VVIYGPQPAIIFSRPGRHLLSDALVCSPALGGPAACQHPRAISGRRIADPTVERGDRRGQNRPQNPSPHSLSPVPHSLSGSALAREEKRRGAPKRKKGAGRSPAGDGDGHRGGGGPAFPHLPFSSFLLSSFSLPSTHGGGSSSGTAPPGPVERSYRAPCVVLVINDNPYGLMVALSYMCRTCP
jgi:hypothetical protein